MTLATYYSEANSNAAPLSPEQSQWARQNMEPLRLLAQRSNDVIMEINDEGEILYVSPNVQRVLGYEAIELCGDNIFARVHPEDLAHARDQFKLPEGLATCRYSQRDGGWRWFEIAVTEFVSPIGKTGRVLIARDISERKQAEEIRAKLEAQLRQAQKLEAVGTLAGGIAHDFNSILTVMMVYTDLADMEAEIPAQAREYLGEVRKACNHAKDLVQQILMLSRKEKAERKPIRLQSIVKDAFKLLRSTLPATVEMDLRIDPAAPVVLGNPTEIHRIMINLCTNAVHAMRDTPGRLSVTLQANEIKPESSPSTSGSRPGNYVCLSVTDTGHGMEAELLERIFEPFFTTKAPGEGTGLGLPVVHEIIKDHQGTITVRSQPGKGTTFDLYFPIYEANTTEAEAAIASSPFGRGERILFVDDDPAICDSVSDTLERLGYEVTIHTDSARALNQFRANPDHFDLVFADLTMPGMSCQGLAKSIAELRPRTPIVLMSDLGQTLTAESMQGLRVEDLITKPTSAFILASAIQRALRRNTCCQ
jgi:two-component system cell cycle sensor histidine kinase/response regulator CckA